MNARLILVVCLPLCLAGSRVVFSAEPKRFDWKEHVLSMDDYTEQCDRDAKLKKSPTPGCFVYDGIRELSTCNMQKEFGLKIHPGMAADQKILDTVQDCLCEYYAAVLNGEFEVAYKYLDSDMKRTLYPTDQISAAARDPKKFGKYRVWRAILVKVYISQDARDKDSVKLILEIWGNTLDLPTKNYVLHTWKRSDDGKWTVHNEDPNFWL